MYKKIVKIQIANALTMETPSVIVHAQTISITPR